MENQPELDMEAVSLLEVVSSYYQKTLNQEAVAFLQEKNLGNLELINRLGVGFADGTLLEAVADGQKSALKRLGVLNSKGKEVLHGSLVMPLRNTEGRVVGLAGHPISGGKERVVSIAPGFANLETLAVYQEEIILVDGVLGFLALVNLGQNNVITSGGQPLVPACTSTFSNSRIKQVVLFTSSTDDLKSALLDAGITVRIPTTPINISTREDIDSLLATCATFEPQVKANVSIQKSQDRWLLTHNALTFRIIGVKDNFTTNLKVSIRVDAGTKKYTDTVDLLSARSRRSLPNLVPPPSRLSSPSSTKTFSASSTPLKPTRKNG